MVVKALKAHPHLKKEIDSRKIPLFANDGYQRAPYFDKRVNQSEGVFHLSDLPLFGNEEKQLKELLQQRVKLDAVCF